MTTCQVCIARGETCASCREVRITQSTRDILAVAQHALDESRAIRAEAERLRESRRRLLRHEDDASVERDA